MTILVKMTLKVTSIKVLFNYSILIIGSIDNDKLLSKSKLLVKDSKYCVVEFQSELYTIDLHYKKVKHVLSFIWH